MSPNLTAFLARGVFGGPSGSTIELGAGATTVLRGSGPVLCASHRRQLVAVGTSGLLQQAADV